MKTEDHEDRGPSEALGENGAWERHHQGIRRGPWRQRTMETEDHGRQRTMRQRTIRGIRRERGLGTAPSEALGEDHGDHERTTMKRQRTMETEDHGDRGPWRHETEDHEDRGPSEALGENGAWERHHQRH
uniref:Uncharacterized protein n=1 Tax=Knipowitschia caucasica TaxID=637954 RepID=A0AAV2LDN0_KNICA